MTWAGRVVTSARDYWRARLPLPCWRCGRPVVASPESGWHVGHVVDRAMGGAHGIENQWPEHKHCNLSAGGRAGAAKTNARRPTVAARLDRERDRGIRGW